MEANFKEKDINLFFVRFKSLPEFYGFEKVLQLISNPHAVVRHKVNLHLKPLKIFIFTSVITCSTICAVFWQVFNTKEPFATTNSDEITGNHNLNDHQKNNFDLTLNADTSGINHNVKEKKSDDQYLVKNQLIIKSNGKNAIEKGQIYGDWFLYKQNQGKYNDTLIFKREMTDSSFTKWSFGKNDTLIISSGFIQNFLKDYEYRMMYLYSLDYYNWHFNGQNKDKFEVKKNKRTDTYDIENYNIILLDNKTLKIIMMEVFSFKVVKSKISKANTNNVVIYYLDREIDSAVFKQDTIVLSKARVDQYYPVLRLKDDSTFTFNYDISTKTILNKKSGMMEMVVIAKIIKGSWRSDDLNKSINLILENGTEFNYKVEIINDKVHWIKKIL